MSKTSLKGFDDRLFLAIGIPIVSLIVIVFFFRESPAKDGWPNFLISFAISNLYTTTYWLLSRWIIMFWRKRSPGIQCTTKRLLKTFASQLVAVMAIETLCKVGYGWEDLFKETAHNNYGIIKTSPISLLLLITMTGIYEAAYYFSLYRRAELDKERLLRVHIENQLDALRRQVDPHFLFNSLNTLVSIIPENPVAAQEFTVRLSATYRRLLELRHVVKASLKQELDALDDYLHLLAIRYEGRLHVQLNIAPSLSEHHIAPLALQLLVENAVKHNEASLSNPLVVEIHSEGQAVTVSNKKRLKTKVVIDSTGFGLENLRDRVRFLNKKELVISETFDRFSVTVPLLEMAPTTQLKQPKSAS